MSTVRNTTSLNSKTVTEVSRGQHQKPARRRSTQRRNSRVRHRHIHDCPDGVSELAWTEALKLAAYDIYRLRIVDEMTIIVVNPS